MIEPKQGYWCTECGNTFTNESIELCQYGDCLEGVCPDCDGKYCENCKTLVDEEVD